VCSSDLTRVCNRECSKTRTNACPTTLQDYCTIPAHQNRDACSNGEFANCYQCETTGGYKVCTPLFQSFCTMDAKSPSPCGKEKAMHCDWTGTKCVCPGLPPRWSDNDCRRSDCK